LKSNGAGFFNTALGVNALTSNVDGARNTAIGSHALYFNNAYDNTATGYLALQNNITGSYNVGVGSEVLFSNTAGGYNTAVGSLALRANLQGNNNTAIGYQSLSLNETGGGNTAVGFNSLPSSVSGTYNTGIGVQSLEQTTTGNSNTVVGVAGIDRNTTGSYNAVLGAFAGRYISDGTTYNTLINNSILIGAWSMPNADDETNQIVIGYGAKGNGSNTIQLGNTSITDVKTSGQLTASGYAIPGGASSEFLKADGSVDNTSYLVREVTDEIAASVAQTDFTLSQTPALNSKVKMYINGIRISNAAYSVTDNSLTYNPAMNGTLVLSAGDRIQFDYYY
jgi:hypothetical protein